MVLSFALLKLTEPQQFLHYFKQYAQSDDLTAKLMIVLRYWATGGQITATAAATGSVDSYAHSYLEELLSKSEQLR